MIEYHFISIVSFAILGSMTCTAFLMYVQCINKNKVFSQKMNFNFTESNRFSDTQNIADSVIILISCAVLTVLCSIYHNNPVIRFDGLENAFSRLSLSWFRVDISDIASIYVFFGFLFSISLRTKFFEPGSSITGFTYILRRGLAFSVFSAVMVGFAFTGDLNKSYTAMEKGIFENKGFLCDGGMTMKVSKTSFRTSGDPLFTLHVSCQANNDIIDIKLPIMNEYKQEHLIDLFYKISVLYYSPEKDTGYIIQRESVDNLGIHPIQVSASFSEIVGLVNEKIKSEQEWESRLIH